MAGVYHCECIKGYISNSYLYLYVITCSMFVILKYYISAFYIRSNIKILYNIVRNVTNTKIYHVVELSSCYYNCCRFSDFGKLFTKLW